jgi:predicted glycoside hydrolase/deacetylase ChbG (UPF0249 family)/putative flippase GtrA
MSSDRIIFNADDFGISLGVNAAVKEAAENGILNSASLMVTQKYATQAVETAKELKNLKLGLHINLTNGAPAASASQLPLLVGQDGRFKNGFLKLFLLSVLHPIAFQEEVGIELNAQMQKALELGIHPTHLDGHRHVHLIPAVFEETLKLQKKYAVERIRLMNECGLLTKRCNRSRRYLFDGGLIKYLLLRTLTMLNGVSSDCYFYTMLYTCKLSREHFENVLVPKGFKRVEIMIHPSRTDIDQEHTEDIFDPSVLSPWRTKELETLLDKTLLNNFHFETHYPWFLRLYQKLERWWFRLPQQGRYLLVGGFNTVFAYAVFALLAVGIGIPYLPALVLQYLITVNVSVLTMRYYVFQSRGNAVREWLKGWTVYLGMLAFNSTFLAFLIEICRFGELSGQAVYLTVSTVLTYFLHKYFSFGRKIKEK